MNRFWCATLTASVLLGGILAAGGSVAHAASHVTRYASPHGNGSLCTKKSPCDILTAVKQAPDGSTVSIGKGIYGSPI